MNNQVVPLDPSTTDGQSFTFTPADEGVYYVTVTVTDPSLGGQQFTDTVQVVSQEGTPVVNPGSEQSVAEGNSFNLTSGFTPTTTPHTTTWTVTQNATYLADDLNPGQGGSSPTELTAFNGKLYFVADAGDGAGTQLWQFDGHTSTRLTDFDPADGGGSPTDLTVAGGSLYFTAYVDVKALVSGLFRYDGTSVTEVTAPGRRPPPRGFRPHQLQRRPDLYVRRHALAVRRHPTDRDHPLAWWPFLRDYRPHRDWFKPLLHRGRR